jgi:ASC-1-like (ASCH) protein
MIHVAIMKKSWGLTQKILSGEKTVETRWYHRRVSPWGQVHVGDRVYFKNSGGPVTVVAEVAGVEQYEQIDELKRQEILARYGSRDLGTVDIAPEIERYTKGKHFCIVVKLKHPRAVEPFQIEKRGFGAMSAWLSMDSDRFARVRC